MIRVGLSGTRYSGKDRISKIFKQIGVPIFDADVVLRFILKYNYELLQKIRDRVGSRYFKDGTLNSNALIRDGLFNDVLDIALVDILHAYRIFESKNKQSIYTILHSSILFERSDLYDEMDYTISVYAPSTHRVERACRSMNDKSFENRILINDILSREKNELDKNEMSTFSIHNYNEFDILHQVNEVDKKLIDTYLKSLQTSSIKKDKVQIISDNFIKVNIS